MTDREKVIEILEKAKTVIEDWVPMFEQYNTPAGIDVAIALLKEQESKKRESRAMLPCKCGSVRREHWYGVDMEALVCKRCGFKVIGRNSADAIRKWNEAVKQE